MGQRGQDMTHTKRPNRAPTQKDVDRFWGHVDQRGEDECWGWLLKSSSHGYGLFSAGGNLHRTSRFAYIHRYGKLNATPITSDFRISTMCENKKCCNPAHLKENSQQEVFDRMRERDQITVGSKHKMSKLIEADVIDIRQRYTYRSSVDGFAGISVDYGVTTGCIRDICIRKTWRHV